MEEEHARPRSSSAIRLGEREREKKILLQLNCIVLDVYKRLNDKKKKKREQEKRKKNDDYTD